MHLSQHHFQAQSRYFEELIQFVVTNLAPDAYGLTSLAFDAEALKNDSLVLTVARGVMPDGLPFNFPHEPLPEARRVREIFSPTQDSHLVLLAIPALLDGKANVASSTSVGSAARFVSTVVTLTDEAAGSETRPVAVAQKRFRLLLDGEDTTGFLTLPLARVRRDGSGHFVFDADFIPPCLQTGASPALRGLLGGLVEILSSRADALTRASNGPGDEELASRWMAHAINENLGTLLHLHRSPQAHPSELFGVLSRLAGSLCTFSLTTHPRDLPAYDHASPGEGFRTLVHRIREMLEVAAPSNTVSIPLKPEEESFYAGRVDDPRLTGRAKWFLGVRSGVGPGELAGRVPRLVNVCSSKHIRRLVREALPGLTLSHVISPPPGLSPRPDTAYFAIAQEGPCWSSITDTREVGIYAPASIPDVALELIVSIEE
jgi:type VI secretion system protein ImpJ